MLKKSWNISDSKFFVIEADEYDTSCFDKEPNFSLQATYPLN